MIEDEVVDPYDPVEVARVASEVRSARQEADDAATRVLDVRRRAYVRVFAGKGTADDTRIVLEDLSRFCRIDSSSFDPDPRVHALLEGRREVMQRIQDFIKLDMEALVIKYTETKRGQ